ncbi:MAG: GAF domain-containing protein [Sedimentisphaerales bacterium]|nr:GAF domain-containing protein [Sedimentisphaerales bacterium]
MLDEPIRVLIVEDDQEQREDLSEIIARSLAAQVETAGSGEDALQLVKTACGDFDVVLMDEVLPGIDGITTMGTIKAWHPTVPVVMFTGQDPESGIEALRQGAYRYMMKPVNTEELTILLRHASEIRRSAKVQERLRLNEMLMEASKDIAKATSREEILGTVFQNSFKFVGQTTGLVVEIEEDKRLRIVASQGVNERQLKTFHERPAYANEGSFGIVVDTGEIYECADTSAALVEGDMEDFGLPIPAQVTNIPLKRNDGIVAILVLDILESNQTVKGALSTLAEIAGIALERVEERETLAALQDIAQVLTLAKDIDEVARGIMETTKKVFVADAVVLHVYDAKQNALLLPPYSSGVRDTRSDSSRDEFYENSAALKVIHGDGAIFSNDVIEGISILNPTRPIGAKPTFVEREGIVSSCAVPLISMQDPTGVLFINYRTPHDFDVNEQRRIEMFAHQAGVAIHNARRHKEERELREQAELLYEVSAALNSPLGLEQVAGKILEGIKRTVGYTSAALQLVRGDSRIQLAGDGFDRSEPVPLWARESISKDRLMRRVIENRAPYVISNTALATERTGWIDRPETAHIKSWVGIPLLYGDETVGLVMLDHTEPGYYDKRWTALLTALGNQAAVAIKKEQRANVLLELQQITKTMRTLEIQASMEQIVKGAVELSSAYAGVIYVIDGAQLKIIDSYKHPEDFKHPKTRFEQQRGLTWNIFKGREPIEVADTLIDARVSEGLGKNEVRSLIGIPLPLRDRVVGVLFLNSRDPRRFSKEDMAILTMLAEHGAIALEQARLFEESQSRARQLAQLQAVTTAITKTPWDLEAVAKSVAAGLKRLYPEVRCGIRTLDQETGAFRRLLTDPDLLGELAEPEYYQPRPDGISAFLLTHQYPLYYADAKATPPEGQPPLRSERINRGARAAAYLPLLSGEEFVGRLSVYYMHTPHSFGDDERGILELFARQAAIALQNAQRFQEKEALLQEKEELLAKLKRSLARTDALWALGQNLSNIEGEL